uniref:Rho-GAP domain-containing protein n=1 Tax=Panagrolaimus superbus TaxID=310955 RepID=A0A914Y4L6_9BILA
MEKSRPAPTICNIGNFTLEQVASYNIHIDTGNTKTPSVITLHEVPGFLIEAFSKFQQLEGCRIEGVFRKEGNSLRRKENPMPVFFGTKMIPPNFLVHDVCSWIKKFFRELRQPIFVTRETRLLKFAESLNGDVLFRALISLLDRLPPSHMGTLGYLMRCLQEVKIN